MSRDPALYFGGLLQGAVPAYLQLRCHKPVRRIGGIVLPECPIGMIAGRFEIARKGLANLVASAVYLASDEAAYMVGQSISPNGGDVMW